MNWNTMDTYPIFYRIIVNKVVQYVYTKCNYVHFIVKCF